MNGRQAFAIENPIDPADFAELKKRSHTLTRRTGKFATILMVDRYWDEVVWHVSIALFDAEDKPRLTANHSLPERDSILRIARELLHGVGQRCHSQVYEHEISVHVLRPLTIEEQLHTRKAIAVEAKRNNGAEKLRTFDVALTPLEDFVK